MQQPKCFLSCLRIKTYCVIICSARYHKATVSAELNGENFILVASAGEYRCTVQIPDCHSARFGSRRIPATIGAEIRGSQLASEFQGIAFVFWIFDIQDCDVSICAGSES